MEVQEKKFMVAHEETTHNPTFRQTQKSSEARIPYFR